MGKIYELFDSDGYTSTVYRIPEKPPRVCKSFNEDRIKTHFPVEKQVYERFTAHDHPSSILRYYGVHDDIPAGLILELAENKNMYRYLWDHQQSGKGDIKREILLRWAEQAAEALGFAHSLGVYNSDIHALNMFLDEELNLKVGDWAGASIDGSTPRSTYRLTSRLVDANGRDIPRDGITALTEIFALGTAFYFMVTSRDPWPDLRDPEDKVEIKKRIQEKQFPDTSGLPALGEIIRKCWYVEFTSMDEVMEAIIAEKHCNITEDAN